MAGLPQRGRRAGELQSSGSEDASDQALIEFLERDQLVADTSVPVHLARLGARTSAALWALRVFVLVVSFMVIYTFVAQLH